MPRDSQTNGSYGPLRRVTGPRGPLVASVVLTVLAAAAVAAALIVLAINVFPRITLAANPLTTSDILDLIKLALAVVAGSGGAVALVVAYRKQHVAEAAHNIAIETSEAARAKEYNERFASAVGLLGNSDSAAIRIGGLYSLVKLADESPKDRQRCVDVLCGYLRFSPTDDRAEAEVRLTISREIAAHLSGSAEVSWDGLRFDLRGATLNNLDFCSMKITQSKLDFSESTLTAGVFNLSEVQVGVARNGIGVDFSGLEVKDGTVRIANLWIESGEVVFTRARFSGGEVQFSHTNVFGGQLNLDEATFADSKVTFEDLSLTGGTRKYASLAPLSMNHVHVRGGAIDFCNVRALTSDRAAESKEPLSTYAGGFNIIEMEEAEVYDGLILFRDSDVRLGKISLKAWKMNGGSLRFVDSHFRLQCALSLHYLRMSGGTITFEFVKIGAGIASDQSTTREWLKRLREIESPRGRDMVWGTRPWAQLDISSLTMTGGTITFPDCHVSGAIVDLYGLKLENGTISFESVLFENSSVVNLWNCQLKNESTVDLRCTDYSAPVVLYTRAYGFNKDKLASAEGTKFIEVSPSD